MEIAKIRLRKPNRLGTFRCGDVRLKRDDLCIVQSDRGQEWGECVLPPEPVNDSAAPSAEFRVVRKANRHDLNTIDMIRGEERNARKACEAKIAQHRLDMKLVEVEYTFDRRKVVFYFTAEDRVDFRELVRDLAHELRVRIELRHIQVRDQAKVVGGLGCCGRELCCAAFLADFKPISMRMAKRQDLSLNPAKISGQCGRLLCCLSYEDEQYGGKKKKCDTPESAKCEACPKESVSPLLTAESVAEAEPDAYHEETGDDRDAAPNTSADTPESAQDQAQRRKRRKKKRPGGGGASGDNRPA